MSLDSEILGALRRTKGDSLSGAQLASQLGVSRAAIWARIEDLRRVGFEIEASPHLGYRLLKSTDRLLADDLMSRLGGERVIGRDIQVFEQTTSTNDIVEKMARDGVREGAVVFAERQTKGRGRLGRSWHSAAGLGLWFSILLRPQLRPSEVTRLTIAASTGLARVIRNHAGVSPAIKWPNDILIGGRKVAGILMEMHAETDTVRSVILGIGINVNHPAGGLPEGVPATSLKVEAGRKIDRPAFAAAVLDGLDDVYGRLTGGEFERLADEWEANCSTLGAEVTVVVGDRRIRGRAESLDPDGALLVRSQHGHLERVLGGDVTLESIKKG